MANPFLLVRQDQSGERLIASIVGLAFMSVRLLGKLASGCVAGFADSSGHIAASLKR